MRIEPIEQYETSPIKLWSLLQRQLAACGLTKGSPQQWIGTIRNLQKKGVSSVEVDWSGILSMLGEEAESGQVFNELLALAAAVEGKPVQERVAYPPPVLSIDELLDFLKNKPPCELVLQRHVTNEYSPVVLYEKQQRPAEMPPVAVCRGRREVRLLHYLNRTFGLHVWLHVGVDNELFGRHKYWSISVPRGEKKLSRQPVGRRFATAQEAMAYGRILVTRMAQRLAATGFIGQIRNLNYFPRYVLPNGDHYTEWLITAPNLPNEYFGEHFDLPNIVAHVRTTERTTPTGKRLLMLEEIQSDWNQELRKAIQEENERRRMNAENSADIVGWDDDLYTPPSNPYLNHWLEAALRMMLLLAADQNFDGMAWLPGKLHVERFPWANADGLATFYDHIVPAAADKLAKSWGAKLNTAQFPTLSRHYGVFLHGKKWQVLDLASGKIVSEDFSDHEMAEAFRRSKEVSVLENVPALYLTTEMQADIRDNGLPYLGSVGKRLRH
jgi:hypothetical protein